MMHKKIILFLLSLLLSASVSARTERISITGDHGQLVGDVQIPEDFSKQGPIVIICHGLTGNRNETLLTGIADSLECRGIASLRFDFNGHGESEGDFAQMTIPNEIEDARRVVKWVMTDGRFGCIGIVGHSQGGVVAAMLAGELGRDVISAVTLLAPAGVLRDYAISGMMLGESHPQGDPLDPPEYFTMWNHRFGREYYTTTFWLPIYETSAKYNGNGCIIHGTADRLVPFTYGQRFHEQWQRSEMHLLNHFDHGFTQNQSMVAHLTADFFQRKISFTHADKALLIQEFLKRNIYRDNILSAHTDIPLDGKVAEIVRRDTILIGTTGDYRPLSFCEQDGTYWGFDIEVAREIARKLGVTPKFTKTSWPTLTADVQAEPQMFDLAIGGITITDDRRETMLMSEGYLANGKTILCRVSDIPRFKSLADIDKPDVTVMVNPGGLNEKFARKNLIHAKVIVHNKNEDIPALVAEGAADVMITEITEAPYYLQTDSRLAAPLLGAPFTHGEIGILMRKGQDDLLQLVNSVVRRMKSDGSLRKLHEKYGLTYAYGTTDTLSYLRHQIDGIDSTIVALLAKRMNITHRVGQYKKTRKMSVVQSDRFQKILDKRSAQGASLGIDTTCVKRIFEAIHEASVNQQKEITNKYEGY